MIKQWLCGLILMTVMVSCNNKMETQFEVTGKLTNMSGKMVYLVEQSMFARGGGIADSVKAGADGSYTLKTKAHEATAYTLFIFGAQRPFATVINDAARITLNARFDAANINDAVSYEVSGSAASTQVKDFLLGLTGRMSAVAMIDKKGDSLQKAGTADSIMQALISERRTATAGLKEYVSAAIAKAENPALVFYELGNYQAAAGQFSLEAIQDTEVDSIIDRVAKKNPGHEGWAYLKTQVEQEKLRRQEAEQRMKDKSWVGKQAPDFSAPDPDGKMVQLSSFRGKYLLVDFWASWCQPCRRENPNVVAAYQKFKGKNFDILGVSLDNPGEKDKWLAAVKQDKLAWTQISELRGWESSYVGIYKFAEEGIPFNILVDPQGKVIAQRLQGPDLEAKLAEVLK